MTSLLKEDKKNNFAMSKIPLRKKIPLYHDFGDDCVPLIILSKRPRRSLIIYLSYYLVLCVFNIARLHVAETDVQYSEAGTQIHALALDLHNKFKQFFLVFG